MSIELTQSTLQAFNDCYELFDEIKKDPSKQKELRSLFFTLSNIDYRTEYDKQLEYIISSFLSGAKIEKEIDSKYRTALNSPRTEIVTDIKYHCEYLLKSHYKYVQQPFWSKYKEMVKMYNYPESISTKIIYDTIQEIKAERKKK